MGKGVHTTMNNKIMDHNLIFYMTGTIISINGTIRYIYVYDYITYYTVDSSPKKCPYLILSSKCFYSRCQR